MTINHSNNSIYFIVSDHEEVEAQCDELPNTFTIGEVIKSMIQAQMIPAKVYIPRYNHVTINMNDNALKYVGNISDPIILVPTNQVMKPVSFMYQDIANNRQIKTLAYLHGITTFGDAVNELIRIGQLSSHEDYYISAMSMEYELWNMIPNTSEMFVFNILRK